jgi:hypothetical protein
MGVRSCAALLALLPVLLAGCASQGDGGVGSDRDATGGGQPPPHDGGGPSPDAIVLGLDSSDPPSDDGSDDATGNDDVVITGKSCAGLPDGMVCGPAPDVCHDAPVCAGGACAPAAPKADGFDCATAPDACHTDGTCKAGVCGAVGDRADGYNWDPGDSTAICCSAAEVHADTSSNCGACGIACNANNGESCSLLGGHYFCRGCVASDACWSKCCSESFSPYSCAASDCAGNCDSTYCPAGTHCVSGGTTSSDYCSY